MRLFGLEFLRSRDLDVMKQQFNEMARAYTDATMRPDIDRLTSGRETGGRMPIYPFPKFQLYEMARHVDVLRLTIQKIRDEMFRNGMELIEKYKYKCADCGKEYQNKPNASLDDTEAVECDSCGSHNLERPDPANRMKAMEYVEKAVNSNKQTLKDVMKEIATDLETADDGFLILRKEYEIDDATGNIVSEKVVELIRGSPIQLLLVADMQGRLGHMDAGDGRSSKPVYVCLRPEHRDTLQDGERCKLCGAQTKLAIVEVNNSAQGGYGAMATAGKSTYYAEGEVIYGSKYMPSLLYGYSNIYAIWMKMMTLYHMDRYLMTYFNKMRSPKGLFIVPTRNVDTLKRAFEDVIKETQKNPHIVYPLAVDTEGSRGGSRQPAQYIDMMRSLQEMQFIDARAEMKRSIMGLYGLSSLFSGDVPSGWSNDSSGITVTNRTVESGQGVLKEKFLDKFMEIIGVEDWVLRFKPSEVIDELRDLQIEAQRITNAQGMQALGFSVELTHQGDFKFSKISDPMMQQTTGRGGMPSPNAPKERLTNFDGEQMLGRPSDIGGMAEGHPASGDNTSLSNKADYDMVMTLQIRKDLGATGDFDESLINKVSYQVLSESASSAYQYNFEDHTKVASKDVRRIVQLAFTNGLTKNQAITRLNLLGVDKAQAELIIDTEYQQMRNRAKELAYSAKDAKGTFLYVWEPQGKHVCDACDEMYRLTKDGVTLDRMKSLIKSVGDKHKLVRVQRSWVLHPRDSCTYRRI